MRSSVVGHTEERQPPNLSYFSEALSPTAATPQPTSVSQTKKRIGC